MQPCTPVIRGGPVFALIASIAFVAPASASRTTHRYSMHASLRPAIGETVARGGSLSAQTSLASSRSLIPVQEGAGLALLGKLAPIALGCADDTIFINGFDNPEM